MKIGHNITALQTIVNLNKANKSVFNSSAKLSSGVKINSAKDDAAGMAIANKLSSQVKSIDMANRNALDGISLIQTADGALGEVTNIIQRMRELAVQSANEVLEVDDREKIGFEINSLREEIDKISYRTEFNDIKLLSGEISKVGYSNNNLVVDTAFIADNVPEGKLTYNIMSVGTPAKISTTYPFGTGTGGMLSINNQRVAISANDTSDIILEKIRGLSSQTGVEVLVSGNQAHLITKEQGSAQSIQIASDNNALSLALGLPNTTIHGMDAVVQNVVFYDSFGNALDSFNNGIIIKTDGNRVDIESSDQRKVSSAVQFVVNQDGSYALKDGTAVDDAGVIGNALAAEVDVQGYGPLVLQVGPNKAMEMEVSIPEISSHSLGLQELNYLTVPGASHALQVCDEALSTVTTLRSKLGAYENRLNFTSSTLDVSSENTQIALGRIMDTDMAKEMTKYTQQTVVSQAGISVLAQANQKAQQLLQLLN